MRNHKIEDADFQGILADIAFASLGIFIILLVIILVFIKFDGVNETIKTKKMEQTYNKKVEGLSNSGKLVQLMMKKLNRQFLEIEETKDSIKKENDLIKKQAKDIRKRLKNKGFSEAPETIKKRASKSIAKLNNDIEELGRKFNKYKAISKSVGTMEFSITGNRNRWYVVVAGRPILPSEFKGFTYALRQGNGVNFEFISNREYTNIPSWAKSYFGWNSRN